MDSLEREESGGKNEIVQVKNYQVLNEVIGSNDTSNSSLLLNSYYEPHILSLKEKMLHKPHFSNS